MYLPVEIRGYSVEGSQILEDLAQDSEAVGDPLEVEAVENLEAIENSEAVENSEAIENSEAVGNLEAVEGLEAVESWEMVEDSEAVENSLSQGVEYEGPAQI